MRSTSLVEVGREVRGKRDEGGGKEAKGAESSRSTGPPHLPSSGDGKSEGCEQVCVHVSIRKHWYPWGGVVVGQGWGDQPSQFAHDLWGCLRCRTFSAKTRTGSGPHRRQGRHVTDEERVGIRKWTCPRYDHGSEGGSLVFF